MDSSKAWICFSSSHTSVCAASTFACITLVVTVASASTSRTRFCMTRTSSEGPARPCGTWARASATARSYLATWSAWLSRSRLSWASVVVRAFFRISACRSRYLNMSGSPADEGRRPAPDPPPMRSPPPPPGSETLGSPRPPGARWGARLPPLPPPPSRAVASSATPPTRARCRGRGAAASCSVRGLCPGWGSRGPEPGGDLAGDTVGASAKDSEGLPTSFRASRPTATEATTPSPSR